jgi:hypothetical protein
MAHTSPAGEFAQVKFLRISLRKKLQSGLNQVVL